MSQDLLHCLLPYKSHNLVPVCLELLQTTASLRVLLDALLLFWQLHTKQLATWLTLVLKAFNHKHLANDHCTKKVFSYLYTVDRVQFESDNISLQSTKQKKNRIINYQNNKLSILWQFDVIHKKWKITNNKTKLVDIVIPLHLCHSFSSYEVLS